MTANTLVCGRLLRARAGVVATWTIVFDDSNLDCAPEMNRFLLAASVFFVMHAANAQTNELQSALDAAVLVEPVQPPQELIDRLEVSPALGDEGVRAVRDFPQPDIPYQLDDVLVKDGLPYYRYYSLRADRNHVVHPMRMGRFIRQNATGAKAAELALAALDIAYELPNGGLAWYYPRHYQVARMLGEKLKYSAISQGTLVAGLSRMAEAGAVDRDAPRGI